MSVIVDIRCVLPDYTITDLPDIEEENSEFSIISLGLHLNRRR